MLTNDQIEILLEKKILIKIDSLYLIKNRCHFTRPEFLNYYIPDTPLVYLFANPQNDLLIDEFINNENIDFPKTIEQDISKQVETVFKLTIPTKESRLTILENEFKEYVDLVKADLFEWETNNLFSDEWLHKKNNLLRSSIDKLLIFDDKNEELRLSNYISEGFIIPSKFYDKFQFLNNRIIYKIKIDWLRNEIDKEREKLNLKKEELTEPINKIADYPFNKTPKNKIKWAGQKNQLYSVIRQLKIDHELINNSFNELAEFIITHFTGFENTAKETVEKELKRDQTLPKPKRIYIDPNKEN